MQILEVVFLHEPLSAAGLQPETDPLFINDIWVALKANPNVCWPIMSSFQQGSSSVYIVLGETSQRRKCLTDTQMWTSNCINIKDGRGIGSLRGFKETVLAGKMKTNMASKAANQELKIEVFLSHYISQTCSFWICGFSADWCQLERAFIKQGVDPKVPKLSCGLAAGFRGLAVLNPTCYWGRNTGKSCKYTTPTLQSACRQNLLIFGH